MPQTLARALARALAPAARAFAPTAARRTTGELRAATAAAHRHRRLGDEAYNQPVRRPWRAAAEGAAWPRGPIAANAANAAAKTTAALAAANAATANAVGGARGRSRRKQRRGRERARRLR